MAASPHRLGTPPTERMAILSIMALAAAARVFFGPFVREDAYITMRYAQHLASGKGFTFNVGDRVLGTTTPLFTVLLAALNRAGLSTDTAAVAVGVAADVVVVWLVWLLGRKLVGQTGGLLAGLCYALATPTVAYAVSGMETSLYLAAIGLTFILAIEDRPRLCAVGCAILVLLRPDGLIVPVALGLSLLWTSRGRPAVLLPPAGIFLGLVLPWTVAAWAYFGSPLPQSMVAKWGLEMQTSRLVGLARFVRYWVDLDDRWLAVLTPLAVVGFVALARRRSARPLLLWTAAYVGAFLAANKFLYPDYTEEWYFLPLLLPYSLAVGAGAVGVGDWLQAWAPGGRWAARGWASLVGGVLLAVGALLLPRERAELAQAVGGRELMYRAAVDYLGERYGVIDDAIATPEIGAIGFRYPGPLIDLYGLTERDTVGRPWLDILRARTPRWVLWFDTFAPAGLADDAWFQSHYRVVYERTNWEGRRLQLLRWYPSPGRSRDDGPRLGPEMVLVTRHVAWTGPSGRGVLRVSLQWRATASIAERRTISVQVADANGHKLAQQDNEPQEGSRPTTSWAAGQDVVDLYDLRLSPGEVARARWITVGGYPTARPTDQLHWRDTAGADLGPRLQLPFPAVPSSATPLAPCSATLAGGARLAGFATPSPGDLALTWEADRALPADYTVFVHALDAAGRLIGQADAPPAAGRVPTSTWQSGDVIPDEHKLPAAASPSRVVVGLYDPVTGRRLARADTSGDAIVLRLDEPRGCD